MVVVWDDEKAKAVADLAAEGLTSTQISNRLGYTRNQIIGVCKRRGIKLHSRNGDQNPLGAIVAKKNKGRVYREPNAKTATPVEVPESVPCTLMELNIDKCHFPLWGPNTAFEDKRYCGAWTAHYPYCTGHQSVVWNPQLPSRKDGTGQSG